MNVKLLKELMKQSETECGFNPDKFAELIVKECALQCVHNEDMDRIEKHFGVEE